MGMVPLYLAEPRQMQREVRCASFPAFRGPFPLERGAAGFQSSLVGAYTVTQKGQFLASLLRHRHR